MSGKRNSKKSKSNDGESWNLKWILPPDQREKIKGNKKWEYGRTKFFEKFLDNSRVTYHFLETNELVKCTSKGYYLYVTGKFDQWKDGMYFVAPDQIVAEEIRRELELFRSMLNPNERLWIKQNEDYKVYCMYYEILD